MNTTQFAILAVALLSLGKTFFASDAGDQVQGWWINLWCGKDSMQCRRKVRSASNNSMSIISTLTVVYIVARLFGYTK